MIRLRLILSPVVITHLFDNVVLHSEDGVLVLLVEKSLQVGQLHVDETLAVDCNDPVPRPECPLLVGGTPVVHVDDGEGSGLDRHLVLGAGSSSRTTHHDEAGQGASAQCSVEMLLWERSCEVCNDVS